jgi:hypothetical protein
LISKLGDVSGRLMGAAILGGCLGLLVALVEWACRGAWLEVRYGLRELIAVNLGLEPVQIGSDSTACTVWARRAAPVALRIFLRDGTVVCKNPVMKRELAVLEGFSKEVCNVTVIVHTGPGSASTTSTRVTLPVPTKPTPSGTVTEIDFDSVLTSTNAPLPVPRPVAGPSAPVVVKADVPKTPSPGTTKTSPTPARSKHPDACPGCGRVNTSQPKQRHCVICDRNY